MVYYVNGETTLPYPMGGRCFPCASQDDFREAWLDLSRFNN
jgi:hypothetical protein